MSTVTTMKSEEARAHFRDILDATVAGHEIVIERYNKPTAVVTSYDQWQRTVQQAKRLKELELLHEVRRLKQRRIQSAFWWSNHSTLNKPHCDAS